MKHLVSFSGGKDSTAMLLMMIEKNMQIDDIFFCDTTLELPEIYNYIEEVSKFINRKINILKPNKSWDDWFYGKITRGPLKGRRRGFPYTCNPCWWNREAKYSLLDKAHGSGNTVYIGIAKDEEKRIKARQYEKKNVTYIFPLCEWGITEKDCFDYLSSIGLPHPLKEIKRSGCWTCPKQSKGSLYFLYKNHKDLWNRLKKYEKDSPHGYQTNFENLDKLELEFINIA